MHGRLKVRTTEERAQQKKKIQAEQVKVYREVMEKVRRKRLNEEYDDELLQATTIILENNPDVTTLWNIRKEYLLHREKCMRAEEEKRIASSLEQNKDNDSEGQGDGVKTAQGTEEGNGEHVEIKADVPIINLIQEMYERDLTMTERCLLTNPKGYNMWHHRCWVLEHAPQTDWKREVALCSRYLKLDERNFHTWDHRRYVAQKAGLSPESEMNFCTEKIKTNFSNYSSWQYRSLLIPQVYPYTGDGTILRSMSVEKLKRELDMVLAAAFTDPNDSSAWLYQRWLLSSSRPSLTVCAFRASQDKAVIGFSRPIRAKDLQVHLYVSCRSIELNNWRCANVPADSTTTDDHIDTVFVMNGPLDEDVRLCGELEVVQPQMKNSNLLMLHKYHDNVYYFNYSEGHSPAYTDDDINEMNSQLKSCLSLLSFEPESRFALLSCAYLMRAINARQHHKESLQKLRELQKVDVLRVNYYKDLMSKWMLQNALSEWCLNSHLPSCLDLTQLTDLTVITEPQYLCIADKVLLPPHLQQQDIPLKTFRTL